MEPKMALRTAERAGIALRVDILLIMECSMLPTRTSLRTPAWHATTQVASTVSVAT